MPEVIWTQQEDLRKHDWWLAVPPTNGQTVIRKWEAWRKTSPLGEPILVLRTASMIEGWNRNGKHWTRWVTNDLRSIKARHDGPWEVRTRSRINTWSTQMLFAEHVVDYLIPNEVDHGLPKRISQKVYYPLFDHFLPHGIGFDCIPYQVMRALKGTDDVSEIARRLFGKTRYRRDLVRAVAQSNAYGLVAGWMFRGLCPTDWIIPAMGENGRVLNLRPLLLRLDQQSLKNLLGDEANGWVMSDICRSMDLSTIKPILRGEIEIPRQRTWRGFHDWLYAHERANNHLVVTSGRRRQYRPAPPFELPEFHQSLVGTAGNLEIRIANHEDMLREWGTEMGNCISGYGMSMRNGSSILGGVYRHGELLGNFEITANPDDRVPYRLNQLLGKFNKSLPDEIRLAVTQHLRDKGVTVGNYWGMVELHAVDNVYGNNVFQEAF